MPIHDMGQGRGIYTNYAVLQQFENALTAQNQNLGPDLASMDGKTVFKSVPVTGVIELDQDTSNPVYGIDWSQLAFIGMRGFWLKDKVVAVVAGQHNKAQTHTDSGGNLVCYDRRHQWVISK
jgi:hypothetical protein